MVSWYLDLVFLVLLRITSPDNLRPTSPTLPPTTYGARLHFYLLPAYTALIYITSRVRDTKIVLRTRRNYQTGSV